MSAACSGRGTARRVVVDSSDSLLGLDEASHRMQNSLASQTNPCSPSRGSRGRIEDSELLRTELQSIGDESITPRSPNASLQPFYSDAIFVEFLKNVSLYC